MLDRAKVPASWKTIKVAHVVEVYLRELKTLIARSYPDGGHLVEWCIP